MGTFLGVPIIRTTVFWGLYWGPPILGNYPISPYKSGMLAAQSASTTWTLSSPPTPSPRNLPCRLRPAPPKVLSKIVKKFQPGSPQGGSLRGLGSRPAGGNLPPPAFQRLRHALHGQKQKKTARGSGDGERAELN